MILFIVGNFLVIGEEFKVEIVDFSFKVKKESMSNVKGVEVGGSKIKNFGVVVDKNLFELV